MEYRITKYDPARRDAKGHYPSDDWTSVTDIGRSFGGQRLTLQDYQRMENAYVEAVASVLKLAGCECLMITDLERNAEFDHLPVELIPESELGSSEMSDGKLLTGKQIELCVRLVLREVIWCKLIGAQGVFIHFGYDFYMYCGGMDLTQWTPPPGLYCEECRSPHY